MAVHIITTAGIANLSDEQRKELIRKMKAAYFKEFFRQGLISESQLEFLLNENKEETPKSAA